MPDIQYRCEKALPDERYVINADDQLRPNESGSCDSDCTMVAKML